MNFRNNRRQMSSQVARSERNQIKLQKIRDRVRQSTNAFIVRQHARMAWWHSAFGSHAVLCRSIFAQASSLWMAFMSLLGLSYGSKVMAGGRIVSRNQFRKFLFEPLEERRVMAIGVTIDANDTPPVEGLSNGQFSVYLYDTLTNAPIASVGNTVVTYSVTAPGATQATPTGAPGGGTFANPFDYSALSGTVTILSGQTEGLINVNVIDDVTTEVAANERVEVNLLTANNGAVLGT
ncbi:MAG TPA: hypothetical protein VM260_11800, partial [Pirellula sp.]|nr:hypothetical protein [Pirellula sp.]